MQTPEDEALDFLTHSTTLLEVVSNGFQPDSADLHDGDVLELAADLFNQLKPLALSSNLQGCLPHPAQTRLRVDSCLSGPAASDPKESFNWAYRAPKPGTIGDAQVLILMLTGFA